MKVLIQRVTKAQIAASEAPTHALATIGKGLVLLCGFEESDTPLSIEQMGLKIKSLRIFSDSNGKMNFSGPEVSAEYLLVSQFTLLADCKYGNRPSFDKAAKKAKAKELYEHFIQAFQRLLGHDLVKHGIFGSDLAVELVNDGPITIWLDSKDVL